MRPDFWRGKRVLLTGHTGFKGSWLSLWLQSLGAQVQGYALAPPTHPSLFEEANVSGGMASIIGDIRDLGKLQDVVARFRPEIVFHMAAQPLVRYSYQNPVETYSTNIMGTVNILEAVRQTPGVRALVNITSDKCYENIERKSGYSEEEPMGGFDPYSSSKGCAELVSAAYRSSFFPAVNYGLHGLAIATARAGNVIGGGDWASDRLIPDVLAAFQQGRPVEIRNPNAVRPWQHVLEPLRGYLTLAESLFEIGPDFAEAWNFGPSPEDAQPVRWIVEKLADLWGQNAQWEADTRVHPHEADYLKLDIQKAKRRLGWQPALGLQDAISLSFEWFRQHQEGGNMHGLTMAQIKAYQLLAHS